ncbi:protein MSN5 [Nadsonia fulvescens var. elongata DSM 6958]|uniref:Protein MSN5 n=1 Tax=Nadsonia fulvescens var. elongata DSM 6958 TaxID=857566 RepID=A0A1E3PIW1_9ASCO|nr:protein MSN5 [Nadsonia fulvescens var. elongata DSM 6958]
MADSSLNQIIVPALEVIHSPRSSNLARREAQEVLEKFKSEDNAPYWGWQLALASNKYADAVRHYGLTLLQHVIQHNFLSYDNPKKVAVRDWIVDLALEASPSDPHYLKEKICFLWVAVAKRIWGLSAESEGAGGSDGWVDMDRILYQMWQANETTRELTLGIFRTLFEDLYMLDDAIAAKRSTVLSAQCIEIVTAENILEVAYERRSASLNRLREGPDGWLNRWSDLLYECLKEGLNNSVSENFAIKVLQTLKTCLHWTFPMAIRQSNLLERLSIALTMNSIKVKILATDCLHVLFTRTFSSDEDFQAIVGAVFLPEGISTLSQVYKGINVSIDDFDEQSYILLKKLVEMVVGLGEFLNLKTPLPENADIKSYLRLVLDTTHHSSLVVSGLSLQFWCSVLRVENFNGKDEVMRLLPELLSIASERCIKYEDVEEEQISKQFLEIDFDSVPETHLFLGNYRRFMDDIVRLTVCRLPVDSMIWLENRMENFFSSELGWKSMNTVLQYMGNPAYYFAHSQFVIVEAALRGISRWKIWTTQSDKDVLSAELSVIVERWCEKIIGMNIADPQLLRKQVQTLVQFAPLLKEVAQLMFRVLEKVLTACTFEYPTNGSDETLELIRDLRTNCGTELNRLAYMMPEALMQIYGDLERVIYEIIASDKLSDHEIVAFKSFLLVVSQRSNAPNKAECFAKIVDPILASWQDEATMKGLMDLPWFMERVGIVKIAEYFRSRGVTAETNLLATEIDETGKELRANLKKTWSALFPIRATRIFIQYTIEKLDHNSQEYKDLLALWKPRIQPILPHILQLIAQIEAYHNPDNWHALPVEVQAFVRYSTMERFWQVGISTQTRDEFVDENVKAMHSLRDFADSVGHIIRYTREYAFLTLGSISQLEETMYELPDIASNLWRALAGDAAGITSHAWRHMISLVLRNVIKNCPKNYAEKFTIEFVPQVLLKLDQVLMEKWDKVYRRGVLITGDNDDETLSEEMMDEHLLRQLTAVVARMLIDMVGQYGNKTSTTEMTETQLTVRYTVLSNKSVLAPFLNICNHIMGLKDSRCSFNSCLILRNLLPSILGADSEVDQFLCDNVMKTCLDILADSYFADVHSEAGYIITNIYCSLRNITNQTVPISGIEDGAALGGARKNPQPSDLPAQRLSAYFPHIPVDSIIQFEHRLAGFKSLRQQRGVFLEFLTMSRGNAQDNEARDMNARENIQRKAEQKAQKERWLSKKRNGTEGGGNMLDTEGFENGSLGVLFGDS